MRPDIEDRDLGGGHHARHVEHGPQRDGRDAEGQDGLRVRVHHGVDVRVALVELGVDEALEVVLAVVGRGVAGGQGGGGDWGAVGYAVGEDVGAGGDQGWGEAGGEVEDGGVLGGARGDVPVAVDYGLGVQDVVCCY